PVGSELILSGSQRGPATYAGLLFYRMLYPPQNRKTGSRAACVPAFGQRANPVGVAERRLF
ncbi:MAG TPA: hypothetical protein PLF99_04630, partial [Tenuifilaceae bacterium]|nr:hypothetical protein [Tenuifilaceae bacterium]